MTRFIENTKESLLARLSPGSPDECWPWQESVNESGYGRVSFGSKVWLAHRLFYTLLVGPIEPGLEIDHTCHTDSCPNQRGGCNHRLCCNPAHLRVVSPADNQRRKSVSGPDRNVITKCVNGHEYTPENSGVSNRGYRFCKICRRITKKRYAMKQKK